MMNEPITGQMEEPPVEQKKKPNLKRIGYLAGGSVLVLALIAAAISPALIQQSYVRDYKEASAEIASVSSKQKAAFAQSAIGLPLYDVQHAEALTLLTQVAKLGEIKDPILTGEQAKALGTAGKDGIKLLGEVAKRTDAELSEVELLTERIAALKKLDDEKIAAAKKAEKKIPERVIPSTFIGSSPASMLEVVNDDGKLYKLEMERIDAVADRDVTSQTVETTQTQLATAKAELKELEHSASQWTAQTVEVSDAAELVASAVMAAATGAPAQAKKVVEASPKAGDSAKKVTESAKAVSDSVAAGDTVATSRLLLAYVAAAQAAQKAHSDAEAAEAAAAAAEAAAAEAAAAGASGYTDPSTGGWVAADNGWGGGGGGGWTAPGGGGGWTPPSGGGGGGGGVVIAPSTPGWTPKNDGTDCPAGTFLSSWDNYGPNCVASPW